MEINSTKIFCWVCWQMLITPAVWDVKTGGSQFPGKPERLSESLDHTAEVGPVAGSVAGQLPSMRKALGPLGLEEEEEEAEEEQTYSSASWTHLCSSLRGSGAFRKAILPGSPR